MNEDHQLRHVYCLGLGGVGVAAVARLLLAQGVRVSGSDPQRNPLVDDLVQLGAEYFSDEHADHISTDVKLLIYTDDADEQHPLRLRANELGIAQENFSATLGRLMAKYQTRITIAGTNGKSTTTALVGLLLTGALKDPTVFVGSRVSEFNGNVRMGANNVFVAEADEYRDHFLNLRPTIAVLTNIEDDHLDYFGTSERMMESFTKYMRLLPDDGVLIANADDQRVMEIAKLHKHVVTFGITSPADLQAIEIHQTFGEQIWTCLWKNNNIGTFTLHLPGEFNILNALAAMAAALAAGADPKTFAHTLESFHGVWRRFQILNPKSSITLVSDYAHHPTAVKVTLDGAKAFYPGRRIIAVFQPHHHSRLTALFEDFTKSFTSADQTIIVETYTVPGRDVPESKSKTSAQLVSALTAQGLPAMYCASTNELPTQLQNLVKPHDVVIIMGAGDIWRTAEQLAKQYAA